MDLIVAPSAAKRDDMQYRQWFDAADADKDGRLTGTDAVNFFSMSQLPRDVLKQVWGIADVSRAGYLGFREFVTAMQVIGLAQAGYEVTPDILKNKDPDDISPPVLYGIESLLQRTAAMSAATEASGSTTHKKLGKALMKPFRSNNKQGLRTTPDYAYGAASAPPLKQDLYGGLQAPAHAFCELSDW